MADSASPILLQRIQSVGSNVNLWGGYVNTDLETLERASKGYQALAVTGDATISWTNYSNSNTGSVAQLKLTGTVTGVLTFPGYQNYLSVWNANSASVTIKCSGGTGVTLATGQRALLYCDGTDYYNAGPTLGPTQAQSTSTYAYAQWGAVQTAIATAALPATAGTVLVDATDTTAGYIGTKITGSGAASVATSGTPGNGSLVISVGALGLTDGGTQAVGFTAASNTRYNCVFGAAGTITLPAAPAAKDVVCLALAGNYLYTLDPNSLKINSSTANLPLIGNQTVFLEYTGATDGWV